jgi:thiol peroxidase
MTKITVKVNPINTSVKLPNIGSLAKDFKLIATDLSTKKLQDYRGQKIVLNIFPSIDTETCAVSVRNFNQIAADLKKYPCTLCF